MRADLAATLTDVMARRVMLAFEPGHGRTVADDISRVLADELGWSPDRRAEEIAAYEAWLDHLAVPDPTGPRSSSFGASAEATR